jgi:tetratricopeptide (TPR) repeat protein
MTGERSIADAAALRFAEFELDLRSGELRREGVVVRLSPQPFRLLAILASHPGELVTRDEIKAALWGDADADDQYEGSLNFCVSQLRATLGDRAGRELIETLRGRGYRLHAEVERVAPVRSVPAAAIPADARSRIRRGVSLAAAGLLGAAVAIAVAAPELRTARGNVAGEASVAVLPFETDARDAERRRFAAGIRHDIIQNLSRVHDLRVVDAGDRGHGEAATELTGKVERSADRIQVTAALRVTGRDETIWSRSYEQPLDNVFEIRRALAERIASTLEVSLTEGDRAMLERHPTRNVEAFDHYLRGLEYYEHYLRADNENALHMFRRAIELDPAFAPAHAALANALAQRTFQLGPRREWSEAAVQAAEQALALDPGLPEGYKALGLALSTLGRHAEAIEAYRRAVALRPGYAAVLNNLGVLYFNRGDWPAALMWQRRRIRLQEPHPFATASLAESLLELGFREEALDWLKRLEEQDPTNVSLHYLLARDELRRGELDAARQRLARMRSLHRSDSEMWVLAGLVELVAGRDDRAERFFREAQDVSGSLDPYAGLRLAEVLWRRGDRATATPLLDRFEEGCLQSIEHGHESWTRRWSLAMIAAIRREDGEAFTWLDRAVEAGHLDFYWDLQEPAFRELRKDPRFEQLVARMRGRVEEMRQRVADEGLAVPG